MAAVAVAVITDSRHDAALRLFCMFVSQRLDFLPLLADMILFAQVALPAHVATHFLAAEALD